MASRSSYSQYQRVLMGLKSFVNAKTGKSAHITRTSGLEPAAMSAGTNVPTSQRVPDIDSNDALLEDTLNSSTVKDDLGLLRTNNESTLSSPSPNNIETKASSETWSLNSYLPTLEQFANFYNGPAKSAEPTPSNKVVPKWMYTNTDAICKSSVDARTRYLVRGLCPSTDAAVTVKRLKDLNKHLWNHWDTRAAAIKCGAVGRLLRVRSSNDDLELRTAVGGALRLLGYSGTVGGRGVRVLSIDGGGVRGLVALEMLRKIERLTQRPIHEQFDLICGVSTGAILAVLVGVRKLPLDEVDVLYRSISERVFRQTTFRGATGLMWNKSYYDSEVWDKILMQHMGEDPIMGDGEGGAKLCVVASLHTPPVTAPFLFRSYTLPHRAAQHYAGSSDVTTWKAVRASAAAPGYFSDYTVGDRVLMDGGILFNNPTALAVHEARQLWPRTPFQSVVSVGTGRLVPLQPSGGPNSWADRLRSVINSATDTEGVHTLLHDLLPGSVYFRFNPHLSEEVALDEIRPERLATMLEDAQLYARKNCEKFSLAAKSLSLEKRVDHHLSDLVAERRFMWQTK